MAVHVEFNDDAFDEAVSPQSVALLRAAIEGVSAAHSDQSVADIDKELAAVGLRRGRTRRRIARLIARGTPIDVILSKIE